MVVARPSPPAPRSSPRASGRSRASSPTARRGSSPSGRRVRSRTRARAHRGRSRGGGRHGAGGPRRLRARVARGRHHPRPPRHLPRRRRRPCGRAVRVLHQNGNLTSVAHDPLVSSFTIGGVPVSAIDMDGLIASVGRRLAAGPGQPGTFVVFRDAHGVVRSQTDEALRAAHHEALLVCADGRPVSWIGRWRALPPRKQVPGDRIGRGPVPGRRGYGLAPLLPRRGRRRRRPARHDDAGPDTGPPGRRNRDPALPPPLRGRDRGDARAHPCVRGADRLGRPRHPEAGIVHGGACPLPAGHHRHGSGCGLRVATGVSRGPRRCSRSPGSNGPTASPASRGACGGATSTRSRASS